MHCERGSSMAATMAEIRNTLDKQISVGKKVKIYRFARGNTGELKRREVVDGTIEAIYRNIVSVRVGRYIECFSKAAFFSTGTERVRL